MIEYPTLIRGTLYPSQNDAAKSLGVSPSTICRALEEGRLDTVGLGKTGRPGKPCYLNGRRWPSRAAAARALDVTVPAVCKALKGPSLYVRPGGKGVKL